MYVCVRVHARSQKYKIKYRVEAKIFSLSSSLQRINSQSSIDTCSNTLEHMNKKNE